MVLGGNFGGGVDIENKGKDFNFSEFLGGFTAFSYMMRFDGFILVFLLPLIVGLYLVAKNHKNQFADSIMFFISGMLLIAPLMVAMTDFNIQPYRFVPLVVFFSIGIGVLLTAGKPPSQNNKKLEESNLEK